MSLPGFMLILFGFLLQWPTILTVAMLPTGGMQPALPPSSPGSAGPTQEE